MVLIFGVACFSMLATCGPKHRVLSSMTPSNLGVGLYLIAFPSMTIFGFHFAAVSWLEFEKKLASLLVAFGEIFHSLDHFVTTSTDFFTSSSASLNVSLVANKVTSSANKEFVISGGSILARLLM